MDVVENTRQVNISFCGVEEPVELSRQKRLVEIILRTTEGRRNVSGSDLYPITMKHGEGIIDFLYLDCWSYISIKLKASFVH